MDATVVAAVASGLMGGGFITALGSVLNARRKAPAEVDSIVVGGAETAVVALERSLAAAERRAETAERTVALRDQQLEVVRLQLEQAQATLDDVRRQLHDIAQSQK